MSEMRVGAHVHGRDGGFGRVEAIVIDPAALAVTHLVVGHELQHRVLVPIDAIVDASPDVVDVDLTEADFEHLEPFDILVDDDVASETASSPLGLDVGSYFLQPFASPLDGMAEADREAIPEGEVTIRRGDEVRSSDGHEVGHIDEFIVHPGDGHLTHVVLREGHVFHHEDVVVPLHDAQFDEGIVTLGLTFAELESLERIPVKRHGHVHGDDVPT
jgi:sporulation protein YlmC with PRC-barrel domain